MTQLNLSKRKIIILTIVATLIFSFFKISNYLQSEESKIRRIIFQGKGYAEKEDILRCLSLVAFDFSDNFGNDRSTLALIGKTVFNQYDDIKIAIKDLKIEFKDLEAIAKIEALGLGKNINSGQAEYNTLKFNITFIKKENQWLVTKIEWLEPQSLLSPYIS